VAVVVPFHGSPEDLADLLTRLNQLETAPGDQLILADNRLGAPQPEDSGKVIIHPAGGVATPGFARNRGAARANAEWLVFIDADTEPEPGLLNAYFATAPAETTGILAGAIVDVLPADGGEPSASARRVVARGHMSEAVTLERPAFPYAQSANCAIRRDAFLIVGGFDEEARAGEDADLCFRLEAVGFGLETRPEAIVAHRARAQFRDSLRQLARHGAGAAWCESRHPGSFPPPSKREFAKRIGRTALSASSARLHGDREAATFSLIELAGACAFEGGRLMPNRARRWTRPPQTQS
jgi:GT2 family glycosyltransferase